MLSIPLGSLKTRPDGVINNFCLQALNSLRAISKQVPDSASWWIEARRVTLKSKSFYPFVDTLSVFMKNAVLQLGLDPDYHSVTLKPHKLLIFEPGRRATNGKLTFENHPSGIK